MFRETLFGTFVPRIERRIAQGTAALSARLPDSDYSESLLMLEPMITQHNHPALTQLTKAPRHLIA